MNDRSITESLPDVLDQALARLKAGESVEACLNAYPQQARDLEPLLRTGELISSQATMPLPAEMEEWLAVGARDFAAIAAQMAPKYAKSARRTRGRQVAATASAARVQFDEILDETLQRANKGEAIAAITPGYPEHAQALDPLLRLGAGLRASAEAPLPPELEAWLPTGRRDFMALAEQMAPRYAAQRRRAAARKLTAQRAAVAVVVVAVMMGAVDTASAQSVPGDTLYTWKRAHENISLALTADPKQRSELLVEYAGRRLQEFNTLVSNKDQVDAALVAETLDSLLDNVQGALVASQQADTQTTNVAPAVKQILTQTKSAITQATVSAPSTIPVLDDARTRAEVIDQSIVTADVALPPTSTAIPLATAANHSSGPGGSSNNQVIASPTSGETAPLSPTPMPSNTPGQPTSSVPTLTTGETSAPVSSPTIAVENTPTIDPATALPPTVASTSIPANTATSGPAQPSATSIPTPVPSNTVVPSATPIPTQAEPTEAPPPTLPPTQRPTRPPLPTPTVSPVPTDTAVPTDTVVPATDTPVPPTPEPPTDTPVPPTPEPPTDTPVPPTPEPPTDTPVVVQSAGDQTATSAGQSGQGGGSTPTSEPAPTSATAP